MTNRGGGEEEEEEKQEAKPQTFRVIGCVLQLFEKNRCMTQHEQSETFFYRQSCKNIICIFGL